MPPDLSSLNCNSSSRFRTSLKSLDMASDEKPKNCDEELQNRDRENQDHDEELLKRYPERILK